jgi:hypothetical protein
MCEKDKYQKGKFLRSMMHLQKNGKDTSGSDGHLDTEARSTGSDLDSGGSAGRLGVGESS